MFEMTEIGFQNWRSQFCTSNAETAGLRHTPMVLKNKDLRFYQGLKVPPLLL